MADRSIRQEFVDGVQEIFTTLFNNGSEETDGVFFYALSDTQTNVYKESKYKHYKPPVLLVCKAVIAPTRGEQDVESVKDDAQFVVTYKSMQENGLSFSNADLAEMRRGKMKFHGVWYDIDNIIPKAYVEDVFLMYTFYCTEDHVFREESIIIDEPEPEEPEVDLDAPDPEVPPDDEDPEVSA